MKILVSALFALVLSANAAYAQRNNISCQNKYTNYGNCANSCMATWRAKNINYQWLDSDDCVKDRCYPILVVCGIGSRGWGFAQDTRVK